MSWLEDKIPAASVGVLFGSLIHFFVSVMYFYSAFTYGIDWWTLTFAGVTILTAIDGVVAAIIKNKILSIIFVVANTCGAMYFFLQLIMVFFSGYSFDYLFFLVIYVIFIIAFFLFSAVFGLYLYLHDRSTWKIEFKRGSPIDQSFGVNSSSDFYSDMQVL
eukprot:TRINITY_DN1736_c0_g1_i1.p1 TRINITY_DN1736_c0_g1~~TRINITY_DN1736_c0_g1_i1.p1  ORF type:complete len:188 (+),score=93.53 TRINITY_DN1736_c0_g1_i1:84-566(+)